MHEHTDGTCRLQNVQRDERQKVRAKQAAPKLTKAAKQAGHDAVAAFQARFRPEGRTPALASLVNSELGRLGAIVAGGAAKGSG